jgi:glycosyltransferase involved in cell wall biosynthesis
MRLGELKESFINRLYFFRNRLNNVFLRKHQVNITFICGFHGKSGGPIAIASIANGLSKTFNVSFLLYASSYYNRLLAPSIKAVSQVYANVDLVICDLSASPQQIAKFKQKGVPILLTIHGLKHALHKLASDHIEQMLNLADKVHFVGQVQQDSYKLIKDHYFIIPNSACQVHKHISANNIGSVGNLDEPRKRAALTVKLGLQSKAQKIHLWSSTQVFSDDPRVVHHSWESDKSKIFNSIDVFVFLSEQETFGLVIAEALSAGIPCVLSSIPAFAPFASCPGVILIEESDLPNTHHYINQLLEQKAQLASPIKQYYLENFSPEYIDRCWKKTVVQLLSIPKDTGNL